MAFFVDGGLELSMVNCQVTEEALGGPIVDWGPISWAQNSLPPRVDRQMTHEC